jgi:hypothetical protein
MGATAFTKWRVMVTLFTINAEAVEIHHFLEELKADRREQDIVPVSANQRNILVKILSAAKSYRIEYQRLELESETVPHTGELIPLKNSTTLRAIVGSTGIHDREPSWGD